MSYMYEVTYSYEHIKKVINKSADDIIEAADLPASGTVDALNLLVSATMLRLADPKLSLKKVALEYGLDDYNLDKPLSGKKALKRIISWINQ